VATIYVAGLTFDYAHIIPGHPKCSRLHGHTSHVKVTVEGPQDIRGMVIDFGLIKPVAKKVIDYLDHKFLIDQKYMSQATDLTVTVTYPRPGFNGAYNNTLTLDCGEVYPLNGPATIENITQLLASLITLALPGEIPFEWVEVEATEGDQKGSIYRRRRL
jgi:6-pyruvoyl tetrahydropterin synthase/QueD family protein